MAAWKNISITQIQKINHLTKIENVSYIFQVALEEKKHWFAWIAVCKNDTSKVRNITFKQEEIIDNYWKSQTLYFSYFKIIWHEIKKKQFYYLLIIILKKKF